MLRVSTKCSIEIVENPPDTQNLNSATNTATNILMLVFLRLILDPVNNGLIKIQKIALIKTTLILNEHKST